VRLRVDGNLAGKATTMDDVGAGIPVRGKIHFIRYGKVVTSARIEETGAFQVIGLEPGVYSVVAVGSGGVGVTRVQVLPFQRSSGPHSATSRVPIRPASFAAATDDEFSCHLQLNTIPIVDYQVANSLVLEDVPGLLAPPMTVPPGGFPGGAAGAGAGAGFGAGDAAALGALGAMGALGAGLSGGHGALPAASPVVPGP
jgi:hypothetical protein